MTIIIEHTVLAGIHQRDIKLGAGLGLDLALAQALLTRRIPQRVDAGCSLLHIETHAPGLPRLIAARKLQPLHPFFMLQALGLEIPIPAIAIFELLVRAAPENPPANHLRIRPRRSEER